MKKLLLILLIIPSFMFGQGFTYVRDTIVRDTNTNVPIIEGIVRLAVDGTDGAPIYTVDKQGVSVYVIYKISVVNSAILKYDVTTVHFPRTEYPAIWNYLTSITVKNSINTLMQNHYDTITVNWNEFIKIE